MYFYFFQYQIFEKFYYQIQWPMRSRSFTCIFWAHYFLFKIFFIVQWCCRSISAKPTCIKKKKDIPNCLKIGRNCIETLNFSVSIYILLLLSYFNAFTCSWYVSNTYHSPVNFHKNSTYCIRSTPVYWSRLGRNCYGTDTYLPGIYSRLGVNFCSVRVPSLPIWLRHYKFNQSAVLLCCVILDELGTFT